MGETLAERYCRELLAEMIAADDNGRTGSIDVDPREDVSREREREEAGRRGRPSFRWRANIGDETMAEKCAVPGCVRPAAFRGVCHGHYAKRATDEVRPHLAADKRGQRSNPSGPKPVRRKRTAAEAQGAQGGPAPALAVPAEERVDDGRIVVRVTTEAARSMVRAAKLSVHRSCEKFAAIRTSAEATEASIEEAIDEVIAVVTVYEDLARQVPAGDE